MAGRLGKRVRERSPGSPRRPSRGPADPHVAGPGASRKDHCAPSPRGGEPARTGYSARPGVASARHPARGGSREPDDRRRAVPVTPHPGRRAVVTGATGATGNVGTGAAPAGDPRLVPVMPGVEGLVFSALRTDDAADGLRRGQLPPRGPRRGRPRRVGPGGRSAAGAGRTRRAPRRRGRPAAAPGRPHGARRGLDAPPGAGLAAAVRRVPAAAADGPLPRAGRAGAAAPPHRPGGRRGACAGAAGSSGHGHGPAAPPRGGPTRARGRPSAPRTGGPAGPGLSRAAPWRPRPRSRPRPPGRQRFPRGRRSPRPSG